MPGMSNVSQTCNNCYCPLLWLFNVCFTRRLIVRQVDQINETHKEKRHLLLHSCSIGVDKVVNKLRNKGIRGNVMIMIMIKVADDATA